MSAEFEKIVLEKLSLLDELKTEVSSLSKKVDNLDTKFNNLEEKVENNTNSINNLTQDVRDTQDILKIQGQNLAHFEHECMLKLNALFDSFVANSESHLAYNKHIAALNAKTYNQNLRIAILEDYSKGNNILATN